MTKEKPKIDDGSPQKEWNEDVFKAGNYDRLMINKSTVEIKDMNVVEKNELRLSLVEKKTALEPTLNNIKSATQLFHTVYDNPLCARYHPVGVWSGKITACLDENSLVCPAFKTNVCRDYMNLVETRGTKKRDVIAWLDKKIKECEKQTVVQKIKQKVMQVNG